MAGADLFTQLINQYIAVFASYFGQLLEWGKWLFYHFSVIAIVWLCLWRAFDNQSIVETMPDFLKEFFLISFFYTIMINAPAWLSSIVDTANSMGQSLTHQQSDPASIIQQGLTIANLILAPVKNSGAANLSIGAMLIMAAYWATLGAFIAVGLNLAITLLATTFFVSLSGLCLAFGTFSATRNIARRTLEMVIGSSFKLLALYIVIYAGAAIFTELANYLPTDKVSTFDVYGWTIAIVLLFCLASYRLPKLVMQLFDGGLL